MLFTGFRRPIFAAALSRHDTSDNSSIHRFNLSKHMFDTSTHPGLFPVLFLLNISQWAASVSFFIDAASTPKVIKPLRRPQTVG
jgi:hypothetical protein